MAARLGAGSGDVFALCLDRLVRRGGGGGNCGQLVVHLEAPPAVGVVAAAWIRLQHRWPMLRARLRRGLRGPGWRLPPGPCRALLVGPGAAGDLRDGLAPGAGELVRLRLEADRLVLTWHHALCDARGAMAVLAALDRPWCEGWWRRDYRDPGELPASVLQRARRARGAVALLRPLRGIRRWRPPGAGATGGRELIVRPRCLSAAAAAALRERQRACTGRLGETPFLLAATAAALETVGGEGGDLVFPLAVDLRPPRDERALANCHGFVFLRVGAGAARRDLAAVARSLKDQLAAWFRAGGEVTMLCSVGCFGHLPERAMRAELGEGGPGLSAACLVANTGATRVPERLLGAAVRGVDHAVAPPAHPGLALLFRRDARGPGFDLVATRAVAARLAPAGLADELLHQLCHRPLESA